MTEIDNRPQEGFEYGYRTTMRPVAPSWRRDHTEVHKQALDAYFELHPDAKLIEITDNLTSWRIHTTREDFNLSYDVSLAQGRLGEFRAEMVRQELRGQETTRSDRVGFASRDFIAPVQRVMARDGYTVGIAPHGPMLKTEVRFDYADQEQGVEFVDLVIGGRGREGTELHLTPEAALALFEHGVDVARAALARQGA
jgi:hypothetical protein